jgi:hypothetical protein
MKTKVNPNRCWSGPSAGINVAAMSINCSGNGTLSISVKPTGTHRLLQVRAYASCNTPASCYHDQLPHAVPLWPRTLQVTSAQVNGGWDAKCHCKHGGTPWMLVHAYAPEPC